MAKKLFITDERMLKLMDMAIQNGLVINKTEFCEKIGFTRTGMSNIKKGLQSFTHPQIRKACILTGASVDYVYGFTNMVKRKESRRAIDRLKEAVLAVETEIYSR